MLWMIKPWWGLPRLFLDSFSFTFWLSSLSTSANLSKPVYTIHLYTLVNRQSQNLPILDTVIIKHGQFIKRRSMVILESLSPAETWWFETTVAAVAAVCGPVCFFLWGPLPVLAAIRDTVPEILISPEPPTMLFLQRLWRARFRSLYIIARGQSSFTQDISTC